MLFCKLEQCQCLCRGGEGYYGHTHILLNHVRGCSLSFEGSGFPPRVGHMRFRWSWWLHPSWGFLGGRRGFCQLAFTAFALSPRTGTADGCPMFRVVTLWSDLLPWGMVTSEHANQVSGWDLKWPGDIGQEINLSVSGCDEFLRFNDHLGYWIWILFILTRWQK